MNSQRIKTLSISIIILFGLILAKFFYYQIIKSFSLREKELAQLYQTEKILPLRGEIRDTTDFPLVSNVTLYQLAIYKPNLKNDLVDIFNQIDRIKPGFIKNNQNAINLFAGNKNQLWYVFPTLFNQTEQESIKLAGVTFKKVQKRFYPEDKLAQPVLNGLEKYYDKQLSGKTGFTLSPKDAIGNPLLTQKGWNIKSVDGLHLHTFLRRDIQFYVEKTLKEGSEQYQADSAWAIVMNVQNGGIIAMANIEASPSGRNMAISDLFEPGSIFKPLVVAMALDSHQITPDYTCPRCDQDRIIGDDTITNWNGQHHPQTNLQDTIKNSDNISMTYIIDKLGLERFKNYYQQLGLEQKSGIDLQGETKPLSKNYWSAIDLAAASFGQGLALTPIQFLQAFNTLANDGFLVQPRVVEYLQSDNSRIMVKNRQPRRVFNQTITDEVKNLLKYSVETGPLNRLKPKDMEVCAKSGTAQVAVEGHYTEDKTIASYVGFWPCSKPQFIMLVTLNSPRTSPWGSETAAPIWYQLADKISDLL
ncbi:MAG TPA: penicillin-binding protein 2 [Candidatus Woesebacteria bacterium]|nr:penicillin-binding protein 2 [Candidatus Woesebacteria bacterium]